MRRFDACALCLQRARDPVACQEGHLFCKECAYTDLCESVRSYLFLGCRTRLVVQKKDIKRQKERLEALKKGAEQEKVKAKEAARERVLAEFEKGQLGLAAVSAVTTSGTDAPGNEVCPCLSERLRIIYFFRPWNQAKIRFRFHRGGKVGSRSRGGGTASNRA